MNCTLCSPFVQVRSSAKVCTGMMDAKPYVIPTGLSNPRRVTVGLLVMPVLSLPCRVKP